MLVVLTGILVRNGWERDSTNELGLAAAGVPAAFAEAAVACLRGYYYQWWGK